MNPQKPDYLSNLLGIEEENHVNRQATVSITRVRPRTDLSGSLESLIHEVNARKPRGLVVIKVNLSDFLGPEQGVTTDPKLIDALVEIINMEYPDVQIRIVETNHWVATADTEFQRMGYTYLEDKYDNVRLVNLSKERKFRLFVNGLHLKFLNVPETLLKANYLISVAVLKTHVFQRISCILKNQFGLIPERYKSRYQPFLTEVLVDLATIYRPDLSLIDGRVGLEGSGPTYGTPVRMNLLLAGNDPVASDATAAKIMKIKPTKVPHLQLAAKRGIGKLSGFVLQGEDVETVAKRFRFISSFKYWLIQQGFRIQRFGQRISGFGEQVQRIATSLEYFKPSMLLKPRRYYRRLAYGQVEE